MSRLMCSNCQAIVQTAYKVPIEDHVLNMFCFTCEEKNDFLLMAYEYEQEPEEIIATIEMTDSFYEENESLRQQVKELSEQVYQLRKELDATIKFATAAVKEIGK